MVRPINILAQAVLYLLFAAVVGYLSNAPSYTHFDPEMAIIKLSFSHAGQRKGECRRRTAEELAKLAPNMRWPFDCPRERLPVFVELKLDGAELFRRSLPATGLSKDGAADVYKRFPVSPGRHLLTARLRDGARREGFDYELTEEVEILPMQNFVVDFQAEMGGFIFK